VNYGNEIISKLLHVKSSLSLTGTFQFHISLFFLTEFHISLFATQELRWHNQLVLAIHREVTLITKSFQHFQAS